MDNDKVMMPKRLTAENGAKALMIGEFFEKITETCRYEVCIPDDCPACGGSGSITRRIPISWTTIKDIYQRIVEHFADDGSVITSWSATCGAFMVSKRIPGITQTLTDKDHIKFYGGENFVCETCTQGAAQAISESMGWTYLGVKN